MQKQKICFILVWKWICKSVCVQLTTLAAGCHFSFCCFCNTTNQRHQRCSWFSRRACKQLFPFNLNSQRPTPTGNSTAKRQSWPSSRCNCRLPWAVACANIAAAAFTVTRRAAAVFALQVRVYFFFIFLLFFFYFCTTTNSYCNWKPPLRFGQSVIDRANNKARTQLQSSAEALFSAHSTSPQPALRALTSAHRRAHASITK